MNRSETHLIFYKYDESRMVSQTCLSLPEAHLIFYKCIKILRASE